MATTKDRLVVFLYLLLRDELPAGVLEKHLKETEYAAIDGGATLSSHHLEALAKELAGRLRLP